ncbi:unnamed protein product [Chrysoparadoxa australica]
MLVAADPRPKLKRARERGVGTEKIPAPPLAVGMGRTLWLRGVWALSVGLVLRQVTAFTPLYGTQSLSKPHAAGLSTQGFVHRPLPVLHSALGEEDVSTCACSEEEKQLYQAIKEQKRLYSIQNKLEADEGSVSVGDWAAGAGYYHHLDMLQALSDGQAAMSKLVRSHQPLVKAQAARYSSLTSSLSYDDLVQEGSIGLMHAAQKFDPCKGVPFGVFAKFDVKAAMLRQIDNKGATVRIPVHVQDTARKIRAKTAELQARLHRVPSESEVAKALKLTEAQVRFHLDSSRIGSSAADSGTVEMLSSGSEGRDISELQEDVMRVLHDYLAPNEMRALSLRFGLGSEQVPHTFREVGSLMHTSAEGIRKLVQRSLLKLQREGAAMALLDYLEMA